MKKAEYFHKKIIFLIIFNCILFSVFSLDKFTLDKNFFIAKGQNEGVCTINQYGYYSIFTKSKQGTAFQIIDKMKGPGNVIGQKSQNDGRIDLLFDEGLYKIRMYSGSNDEGNVTLNIVPFKELNSPDAPVLKNNQYIETALGDFEQLSYWIEAKSDEMFFFEASGRSLSNIYVWKDGSWLIDAKTFSQLDESIEGKPRNTISLCEKFEPGYYKITLYGREPLKWANEDKTNPLFIRYGANMISTNSRFVDTISSMGKNRYLVSGNANHFLLQSEDKDFYKLMIKSFNAGNPDTPSYSASIDNKARTPECKINNSISSEYALITVTGKPGKKIALQTFKSDNNNSISVSQQGKYWLSTIHSGYIGDNIEPEGFLVEYNGNSANVIYKNIDIINSKQGWQGKFNLLDEVTLYLDVEENGNYLFDSTGVEAEVKVEKFFLDYPKNYVAAKYKKLKFSTNLEKGINIIRVKPVNQGIITLLVKKDSLLDFIFRKDSEEKKIKGNVQFPSVDLTYNRSYRLFVNEQGRDVDYGIVLRKYPLNLDEDLPVILKPNEEISFTFICNNDEKVLIDYYKNNKFTAKVDNNKIDSGFMVRKGQHTLYLKNNGDITEIYSVKTIVPETPDSKKPSYLSTNILKSFPTFDTIKTGEQIFFDLDVNQKKTFLLNVDKAGIYSLESTGRLNTKATVRTRTITGLFNAQSNGVGRNFLLHTYLKEGIYQVMVETLGISKGHLGVIAKYSQPIDGGSLLPGKTFRDTLDPGLSVLYKFDVTSDGTYRINTIGLNGKVFNCRLEDQNGWPLLLPGIPSNLNEYFTKGSYRMISMPSDVWGRRLTSLVRIEEKKTYKPKEPVDLKINEMWNWQWMEVEKDNERINDSFYFTVPASMNIKISFTENMMGVLSKVETGAKTKIIDIYPDRFFDSELKEGKYLLELHSQKIDNYTDYSVIVYSEELVEGLTYNITAPKSILISVKDASLVEISSKGNTDVDGSLYSLNNELLDYSDDDYSDWNFSLFDYLPGGKYILKVNTTGSENSKTTISMRSIPEKNNEDLPVHFDTRIDMKGFKNNFKLPKGPALISIDISANSFTGVSITEQNKTVQKDILKKEGKKINFDFIIPAGKDYYLSLWSMDHLDENLSLKTAELKYNKISLADISSYKELPSTNGKVIVSMSVDIGTYSFDCIDSSTGKKIDDLYFGFQKNEKDPVNFEKFNDRVSTMKGNLFIKAENPESKNIKIKSSKIYLNNDNKFITLNKNSPYFFDINPGNNKIGLLISKGDRIQPLCGFLSGTNDNSFRIDENNFVSSKISINDNRSVDVCFSGKSAKTVVWNPEASDGNENAEMIYKEFDIPKTINNNGFIEDALLDTEIKLYSMPKGQKKCEVSLDNNMIVFTIKDKNVADIYHTSDHIGSFSFYTQSDSIGIIKYGSSDGYYRMTVSPNENKTKDQNNILLEKNMEKNDDMVIYIQASKDANVNRFVNITGDVRYSLITSDGRLIKGNADENIPIDNSWNMLKLEYNPGFVKAWLSAKKDSYKDRWGNYNPESVTEISNIKSISLSNKPLWYSIKTADDSIINLYSNNPLVYTILKNGNNIFTDEISGDSNGSFVASKGDYIIGVRSLMSNPGSDNVEVSISAGRLPQIKENEIKEYLLSNKEPRGFLFSIEEKQDIGIGYKADNDMITCLLYNEKNELIRQAPVIFAGLEKGKYFIVYKIKGDLSLSKFYPIIISSKTVEQKFYNEYVKEFLEINGFMKKIEEYK